MDANCEFNDDELIPPEWINKEFLSEVLRSINNDAEISTFTIRPASGKGDHYASIMFRATIECTRETNTKVERSILQVIIKTRPPSDTPKGRNLSETQIFENEWKMYTQVIPLLEAEWEHYGEKVKFAGRLLYATLHPQPVIVLEDLCLSGYDILRGRLFSLSEVESCLRKLAKWHAVSYKLTTNTSSTSSRSSNSASNTTTTPSTTTTNTTTDHNNTKTKTRARASNITTANAAAHAHAHAHAIAKTSNATNKDDITITAREHRDNVSVTEKQQVTIVSTAADVNAPRTMTNAANTLMQMQQGLFKQKSVLRTEYISSGVRYMITALEDSLMFDNNNEKSVGNGNGDDDDDDDGAISGNAHCPDNSLRIALMKLRSLEPHIITACMSMNDAFFNGICGSIYVLNHGDFHTTNIMTRRTTAENEQLREEDIRFIDFQASFFGPMAFDLQYASFTLFSRELRDTKRNQLMEYYFEHFLHSLRKLKFNGEFPTYNQFLEDCKRWRCFELFLIGTFLPLTRLNKEKPHDVDINEIFDNAVYRENYYRNPDYLRYVRELLPNYLDAGYLDEFKNF